MIPYKSRQRSMIELIIIILIILVCIIYRHRILKEEKIAYEHGYDDGYRDGVNNRQQKYHDLHKGYILGYNVGRYTRYHDLNNKGYILEYNDGNYMICGRRP